MSEVASSHAVAGSIAAAAGTEIFQEATREPFSVIKQPPPEKQESIWARTRIILSFWVVIVCLGLPMWWKTTSIYRAPMPFQAMSDWDQGNVCLPTYPLEIRIFAGASTCAAAKHFVQITQHALDDLNEFAPHHLRLRLANSRVTESEELDPECRLQDTDADKNTPALSITLAPRRAQPPRLQFNTFSEEAYLYYPPKHFPSQSVSTSDLTRYLANELHKLFKEEQASVAYKFATLNAAGTSGAVTGPTTRTNGNPSAFVRSLPKDLYEKISSRSTRSFKYADTYYLTFSLFSAGAIPSSWDITKALNTYIQPWVDALSTISHFEVNSQIQLYSQLSPSVHLFQDSTNNGTLISHNDLSAFVNAAEWPLSPSIGPSGPTINFVLYIPSVSDSPLTIAGGNGATEWLIPQWGGVAIFNPIATSSGELSVPDQLDAEAMAAAFSTFRVQLLSLLGLPGDDTTPLPLKLQSLTRLQTTSLFLSASSTLGSLGRLTQSLPSIPIPESVSHSVESTITHLQETCRSLEVGQFEKALQHAREAEKEAEKAFFEKSMVGQVYFEDEHKIAVYLPLLGPVSFPLILGLIKEIKGSVQRRKQR